MRGLDLQAIEQILHLVGAHRADQIGHDRHGMTLRALGELKLPAIAQRVHDVAPMRLLLMQRDATLIDRVIDGAVNAAAIEFC